MDTDDPTTGLDPLEGLAEEYLRRHRAGERPTPDEYAARHPKHAERIRELFPALAVVERLKPTSEDRAGRSDRTGLGGPPAGASPGALRRLGDYAIIRELGRGGMGVVYEAEHESLKSRVALKVMHPRLRPDPTSLRRFEREARSAARLHHTNIVPVFDFGEQDGICYYAMQFIAGVGLVDVLDDVRRLRPALDGASQAATGRNGDDQPTETVDEPLPAVTRGLLTGRFATAPADPGEPDPAPTVSLDPDRMDQAGAVGTLDRPAPVPSAAAPAGGGSSATSSFAGQPEFVYFREVARLGAQIADAIEYAHRQNVVHRDIKPSNLLLDAQGNVWVTDFGLAKLVEGDDLSQSHDLVGTLRFMAPERFRGVTDRRGDIYALGATLYELLALRPAFAERDQILLIDQIVHQTPTPLRQHDRRIPRDLETIVHKVLSKDARDRCNTAGELRDELRRFVEGRPTRWRQVGPVEKFRRWCRRNPWLAAANITAAVLTTLLAIGSTIAAWIYSDQVEALQRQQVKTELAQQGLAAQLVQTQKAETRGRERLFESLVSQAQARRVSRRMGQRFETLDALEHAADLGRELKLPPEKFDLLRDEAIACLALPDLKPASRVISLPSGVVGFTYDSTMSRYALRLRDGTISVQRFADDQEVARFQAHGDRDICCFSPDGRYLATRHEPSYAVTVWDVDRRAIAVNDPGVVSPGATFSPDSRRIVLSRQGTLLEHELATGKLSRRWPGLSLWAPVFKPDGTQIAVIEHVQKNYACRIIDAESGGLVRSFPIPTLSFTGLVWSPDGATLATPCDDQKIYLWDAATGTRRATLEGHINSGLQATFHPAGTLLASNGFEGRLWLWDSVLGRPWLTLSGFSGSEFSRDGQIVVVRERTWAPYQVDPALEYRTFAHVSSKLTGCYEPSIRCDGRVLAVGTRRGVVLWDLARGAELAFLPIGLAWHLRFEPSGDLLTSGSLGVQRWPIYLDLERSEFHIGPPRRLSLPGSDCGMAKDRSGRIVAQANHDFASVATPERTIPIGPLDDCRSVAVSPDGLWLATGSHVGGAQVWRISDAKKVAELPVDGITGVVFSPDGKWLMTENPPSRLWEVGTWRGAPRQVGGVGKCFSPDGRLVVVEEAGRIIRLVETETGRTLARLESPDLCAVQMATISPDGSRLVVTTNDIPPAVHVWDLRAIRRQLARIGLDWDAPAYSDDDPASPALPPLPPLQVDLGPSPLTWQPEPRFYEFLIAGLETMLARQPDQHRTRGMLAHYCNHLAWALVAAPGSTPDAQRALSLARRAVELAPRQSIFLNTLGVAQYRAGRYAEALTTLEKSLAAGKGGSDAFDLFFLAMARYRLGRVAEARADFDRAVKGRHDHPNPAQPGWSEELNAFEVEARALLDGPSAELPADVFAPEPPNRPGRD
jgi:serine/threonine protein kinase/WD40 repeat protein